MWKHGRFIQPGLRVYAAPHEFGQSVSHRNAPGCGQRTCNLVNIIGKVQRCPHHDDFSITMPTKCQAPAMASVDGWRSQWSATGQPKPDVIVQPLLRPRFAPAVGLRHWSVTALRRKLKRNRPNVFSALRASPAKYRQNPPDRIDRLKLRMESTAAGRLPGTRLPFPGRETHIVKKGLEMRLPNSSQRRKPNKRRSLHHHENKRHTPGKMRLLRLPRPPVQAPGAPAPPRPPGPGERGAPAVFAGQPHNPGPRPPAPGLRPPAPKATDYSIRRPRPPIPTPRFSGILIKISSVCR